MKKPKIFMGFFYVSFRKKSSIFGFSNFILDENKNVYGNIFIPWKSHWNIGLLNINERKIQNEKEQMKRPFVAQHKMC